jgi:hypothetical protein
MLFRNQDEFLRYCFDAAVKATCLVFTDWESIGMPGNRLESLPDFGWLKWPDVRVEHWRNLQ